MNFGGRGKDYLTGQPGVFADGGLVCGRKP